MSRASVHSVLSRLMTEKRTRAQFAEDPESVFRSCELTDEEKHSLKELDVEGLVKRVHELREFVSPVEAAIGSIYI